MKNSLEEQYVFLKTCKNDFRAALKSFSQVDNQEFGYPQLVYLRDAVVSYGRPFSKNIGIHTKYHNLKIDVPNKYLELHNDIINLRNTLFAHSDIKERNPELLILGNKEDEIFVIDSKPIYLSDIKIKLADMGKLVAQIQKIVIEKMTAIEKNL